MSGRGRPGAGQLIIELPIGGDPRAAAAADPGAGGPAAISAVEIARLLGRPEPTPEQAAVIEAPPQPLLVVAGAGSGKTETMAGRVVWLVANGHARPGEVLGLTFTRKAAGELTERVRARLRGLARRGALPGPPDDEPVTVATYHSYAAAMVGDHGLRYGIEPSARLLSEAGAWQLAQEVVQGWDGDMSGVDIAAGTAVAAVLDLAGECAEHLLDPQQVLEALERVVALVQQLPAELGEPAPGPPRPAVRDLIPKLLERCRLLPLVEEYARRKRRLGVLDFGDQVAIAARIAADVPEVGALERQRFRVVLLDEYQDTSHAQLQLLRALYGGGHPVTAVGDPHQSIYGWRGASAGNLQRFGEHFPGDAGPARVRYLSTSWRNDAAVLRVANAVAGPLREPPPWGRASEVPVRPLDARPGAGPGAVRVELHATVDDEARAVAEFAAEVRRGDGRRSVAVLCRKRAQFPILEAALRLRGLPVEVVGLGGLLHVPEVADLRAVLEVVNDPSRGGSLMRLLTGPAWRIGPRDLETLGAWAGRQRRHDLPAAPDEAEQSSIVEALDDLPPPGWTGPAGDPLSPAARGRLSRLGDLLRGLRARAGAALPDLVLQAERAIRLDIEVAARPGVDPAVARAHLDAFVDVAAGFAADRMGQTTGSIGSEQAGLGAFLAWLAAAEHTERGLEPGTVQARDDAVQILTVHAAKGLEWDAVAVPGLVEGGFPTAGAKRIGAGRDGTGEDTSKGWLGERGAVPYPLRGDAGDLPHWAVEAAVSQRDLLARLEEFTEHCGHREIAEERRLMYVAVTRARSRALLTGAVWGEGTARPRAPSRFLADAAQVAERGTWSPSPEPGESNPRELADRRVAWPADPLGEHRAAVEAGAALVRAAIRGEQAAGPAEPAGVPAEGAVAEPDVEAVGWEQEVELLLAERDARREPALDVLLPEHLSASQVVAMALDPAALALQLRRPMPAEPSPRARRGSSFHAWLERRFGAAALVDVDDLPGAGDAAHPAGEDDDLAALQARFLASEWAGRTAEAVEVAVETPVDGVLLRGRIDAVFRRRDGGWEVVDWKTGRSPSGADATARAAQLAVYRLAWARVQGVPLHRVGAAFFYAATGETVRPVDLLDEAGLHGLIAAATDAG